MGQPHAVASISSGRAANLVFSGLALLLLFFFVAVPAQAQPPTAATDKKAAPASKHPKVAPEQECSACHGKEVKQWESGPHGQNQVKCLVCHGALEEGFMAKPPVSRCEACHDREVAQLKTDSFMKRKTCFTCHAPHLLKPHQGIEEKSK